MFKGIEHAVLLFRPWSFAGHSCDNVKAQIEKLATMGELYSRYAKWCLAEAAVEAARNRKDMGEAASNVAETKQLLEVAETWAESISHPATFRLDRELEATKARIASLKRRVEGPPQR